jgi:DNA-directed RNA polymerase subunit H (RpoH/RPB5)
MELEPEVPRYYLSPVSGRVIKSTGKLYNKLKKDGYVIEKHKCLYNVKSAQRCLNKLLGLHPRVKPPSSFMKLAKTYKRGPARSFIKCNITNLIIGFVDKRGEIKRLEQPVEGTPSTLYTKDFTKENALRKLTLTMPLAEIEAEKEVKEQLQTKPIQSPPSTIIFNPVQNDFVQVHDKIDEKQGRKILDTINTELVPETLPVIKENEPIAGIIKDNNTVVGVVTQDNTIQKASEPIPISPEKANTLPVLEATSEVKVEIARSPEVSPERVAQAIECPMGEQLDVNTSRCLPCSSYNLEWDAETKKCKVKIEKDIGNIYVDGKDNILGYSGEVEK